MRLTLLLLIGIVISLAAPAAAEDLGTPAGRVVLTVEGAVSRTNAGDTAQFDLAMLEAMPQHEITTSTPWAPGLTRFSGPRLSDLLDRVGANGTALRATALNDYRAVIPMADAAKYGVILALRADGRRLSVRERGPVWVIYPLDCEPAMREAFKDLMVWQLSRLRVE